MGSLVVSEEEEEELLVVMKIMMMSWQTSLLSDKRKKAPPLGLRNLGNSCYLNSVLQCLTYTPPLANFCLQSLHSARCDSVTNGQRNRDCPFCLVEKRINRSLTHDSNIDAPARIHNSLNIFADHFRTGRQEDAHEFLRYLIDACHNISIKQQKKQWSCKAADPSNDTSIVKEIFGGALQSQLKCLSCGSESNKADDIMDLSLDILHSTSLKQAMLKFFHPEILDGNNKYSCDNCKKLVAAKKQMSILRAPNILVIQLKRFEGAFGGKIDKYIAFEEILILSGLMCKQNQDLQPQYNLFGTIVHSGYSSDSGHYYAYIKDAMGRWYCCNDSFVKVANLEEVLSEKVYILFFSRATNQKPGSVSSSFASNGVKSSDSGSCAQKSPKKPMVPKAVNTKSNFEELSPSKHTKASFTPRVKFEFVGKSGSKTVNGSTSLHESQKVETNGFVKSPFDAEKGKKNDILTHIDKNGSDQNGTNDVDGEHHPITSANGNGTTLDLKANGHKDNSVETVNHERRNGHSDKPGSKRKSPEESCIFLAQDAESRLKLEELKDSLMKEASSVLQSCGWCDDVCKLMRSTKRICIPAGNAANDSDAKKLLIADAKAAFISKLPEALKADLINRLRSFG